MTEIFTIIGKVEEYLIKYKSLRDDDNRLMSNIWAEQLRSKGRSISEFLPMFSKGELASPESIRRCRQKLQENNPQYRGQKWGHRKKAAKKVKSKIHSL
jgi:hypothetical protein